MNREQFIGYVLAQMYGGEARHVYLIERDGVTLTVHAPRGNNFVVYQIGMHFDHRFPWLEDDELEVVRHARDIGATIGIDEAHAYLTDYGFTVTRSGDDPDPRYSRKGRRR
jgi:hypothetical protein